MHEQESILTMGPRQLAEKLPAPTIVFVCSRFDLRSRPENCLLSRATKPFRIEQSGQIMIPQDAQAKAVTQIDAFARVRSVTDDISQTINRIDRPLANVCQNGLEGFQVSMDVADDSNF